MSKEDDKPLARRQFFRKGLGELLKPLAKAMAPVEQTLKELERLEARATGSTPPKNVSLKLWLRPPGALAEQKFLETCSRCGECVKVCPAEAIKLDPTGQIGTSAPYIDADAMACVACDGLYCMSSCPSGALVPTPLNLIKMGTAVWHEATCVRMNGDESCQKCVDICPIGTAAIEPRGLEIVVHPKACIGCGLCQQHCPTEPKSINVIPKAARES